VRIVLIGPSYPFRGGISHYTTLMYQHLAKRHDVRFLSLTRQYPSWLYPGQTDLDHSEFAIQAEGTERVLDPSNPVTWLRAARRARQHHPDLIILPWWVGFWAPSYSTIISLARWRRDCRVVYLCHNVTPHERRRLDRLLAHVPLSMGDGFIVHSSQDEANLRRLLPGALVKRTVHPTYDIFNRLDIEKAAARERLGATDDMILFFGFVRPYKGLRYLVQALPQILRQRRVQLWIVGEFWQNQAEYERLIRDLGLEERVRIVNQYVSNEDVGVYFSAADMVVLPYVSGTGSGIAQIAYGYERPIVGTAVGDLPEIIEPGETGQIVPPGDPGALAQSILDIYRRPDSEWRANIRARRDRFSWDNLVRVVEDLAEEVGACSR
jgi:glycosyltransferase involved in cell wall biosynthesis